MKKETDIGIGYEAIISECSQYRYVLKRPALEDHIPTKSAVMFVMLNPSTADNREDDRTVAKCRGFAKRWGCNGIVILNLYAIRSTDWKKILTHSDPIGPKNDEYLRLYLDAYKDVVCAWGNNAKNVRVKQFLDMCRRRKTRLYCLQKNQTGNPVHPLYVSYKQPLIEYEYNSFSNFRI